MISMDDFPKLPPGFRWTVEFSTEFGMPRFIAKVKRRRKVIAKGADHLNRGLVGAPRRAALEAYKDFLVIQDRKAHEEEAYSYAVYLNIEAHR